MKNSIKCGPSDRSGNFLSPPVHMFVCLQVDVGYCILALGPRRGSSPGEKGGGSKSGRNRRGNRGPRKWDILVLKTLKSRGSVQKMSNAQGIQYQA